MVGHLSCGIMNLLRLQLLNLALITLLCLIRLLCLVLIVVYMRRCENYFTGSRMVRNSMGRKDKKLLFFINNKKKKSPFNNLITRNLN